MRLLPVFIRLHEHYGPQHWWPGETPFEIMVGAVLTQNTAWANVERAIANLRRARALEPERILRVPPRALAAWIRPAGYFNVKARRLRNFCRWYLERGGYQALKKEDTATLRHDLLSVNGVGPETADDILLYAFERPVFVIDAYTRRIFSRLGLAEDGEGYEHLRRRFEAGLEKELRRPPAALDGACRDRVRLFNEYHALIVAHGKTVCRVRPNCPGCCLSRACPSKIIQD